MTSSHRPAELQSTETSSSLLGSGSLGLLSSLLLLDKLRDELLILLLLLLGGLPAVNSLVLDGLLSADLLLGDESLDLWCLVIDSLLLVAFSILDFLLDFSVDNVLTDIVELLIEVESGSDSAGSLSS